MEKARILVVEDEAIIARDIQRRLEANGYDVSSVVSTGAAAVRKACEDRPDMVLMDIVLPGELDGIDAAGLIRAKCDIPVIYLTAYTDKAIVQRAVGTEPFGYITKPFEDSELCRTIDMGLYKHGMERRLRESEEWFAATLGSIGEAVIATDRSGSVKLMNPVAEKLTGWMQRDAVGRGVGEVFRIAGAEKGETPGRHLDGALSDPHSLCLCGDYCLTVGEGGARTVACRESPIIARDGSVSGVVIVFRDVTAARKAEEDLKKSREELEVRAREIGERNTALKVLLEQRERDRELFEEQVLSNMRHLVIPFVERLKTSGLSREDRATADILKTSLEQVTSSFSKRLSSRLVGLTPQEIRIASLIKEGRQDKEITEALNISFETVKTHRQNIRKKLGIYGGRKNLKTFLMKFAD